MHTLNPTRAKLTNFRNKCIIRPHTAQIERKYMEINQQINRAFNDQ